MCLKTAAPAIRNAWAQPNRISSRLSEAGVPVFPIHDFHQRKDTLSGRSNSSVGPTYPQAGGLRGEPTEMGKEDGCWADCICDSVKAMTQAALSGPPHTLKSLYTCLTPPSLSSAAVLGTQMTLKCYFFRRKVVLTNCFP